MVTGDGYEAGQRTLARFGLSTFIPRKGAVIHMARYEIWVLQPIRKPMDLPSATDRTKTIRKTVIVQEPRYWKDAKDQEEASGKERGDECHRLTTKNGGQRFYVRDRSQTGDQNPAGTAEEQAQAQAQAQ